MVNQTLARALFGREDVVGERVPGSTRWNSNGAEIAGVLADLSFEHPSEPAKPFVFTMSGSLVSVMESDLTAALVVLLAAFGFYGTQRYLVAAGRRECAIRAALGAGPDARSRPRCCARTTAADVAAYLITSRSQGSLSMTASAVTPMTMRSTRLRDTAPTINRSSPS